MTCYDNIMDVIINFLTDAAKIIFGSAVVGFFIPGIVGNVSATLFLGGILVTITFLFFAAFLSKQKQTRT